MTTNHEGLAYFVNEWGLAMSEVTLRHRRGNVAETEQKITWRNVAPDKEGVDEKGNRSYLKFTYITGRGSPEDYWWILFSLMGGETYQCSNNFYCSLSSDDNGIVKVRVGSDVQKLYIDFSNSSKCEKSIKKV